VIEAATRKWRNLCEAFPLYGAVSGKRSADRTESMMSDRTTDSRPSWDTYFMDITALVAKRSTCTRGPWGPWWSRTSAS
jgi:deoxycytidylate deaminase